MHFEMQLGGAPHPYKGVYHTSCPKNKDDCSKVIHELLTSRISDHSSKMLEAFLLDLYMGVSENSGTPKSSILIGVFRYKPSILGYHYFWKHPHVTWFLSLYCYRSRYKPHLGASVHLSNGAMARWTSMSSMSRAETPGNQGNLGESQQNSAKIKKSESMAFQNGIFQ